MRAIVYTEPRRFTVTEVPDRPLTSGEIRVENLIVGVCGTDQHLHEGEFGPRFPLTPGHEIVGTVVEAGPEVRGVSVGQRVAIDNTVYCMSCDNCKRGDFNFCSNRTALGVELPGGFAEHTIAAADRVYPIDGLDLDAACLIEPTACVVRGLSKLNLRPGQNVLIVGAGPTSQILLQLLARGGAGRVTIAAPTQSKLDLALAHGANDAVLLQRADFLAAGPALRDIAPDGFDVVVEATGAVGVLSQIVPFVRSGGTLMVYGMANEDARIDISPHEIFRREITIKGSFAQAYGFAPAIEFLRAGKVKTDGIITHRFSLDQYGQALDALRSPGCLKAVIEPQSRLT